MENCNHQSSSWDLSANMYNPYIINSLYRKWTKNKQTNKNLPDRPYFQRACYANTTFILPYVGSYSRIWPSLDIYVPMYLFYAAFFVN